MPFRFVASVLIPSSLLILLMSGCSSSSKAEVPKPFDRSGEVEVTKIGDRLDFFNRGGADIRIRSISINKGRCVLKWASSQWSTEDRIKKDGAAVSAGPQEMVFYIGDSFMVASSWSCSVDYLNPLYVTLDSSIGQLEYHFKE